MEAGLRKNCAAVNKESGFLPCTNLAKKYSDLPKKSVDFVPGLW